MSCPSCGAPLGSKACGKAIPACPFILRQKQAPTIGLPWWLGFLKKKPKKFTERELAIMEGQKQRRDAATSFIARLAKIAFWGGIAYVAYLVFRP